MATNSSNNTPINNLCPTSYGIISSGGNIFENNDGTVSVYLNNSQPYHLNKQCCEYLNSKYYFDIVNQQCRWIKPVDCNTNNPINIILNPKGNDGNIFTINENDNCYLNISFDFLIQISCDELAKLGTSVISGNTLPNNNTTERLINQVESLDNNYDANYDYLVSQLNSLNEELNNTPHSFEYNGEYYCLTESGLKEWEIILGSTNYNNFINGDLTTYTNENVETLFLNNQNIISSDNNTDNELFYSCDVDPNSITIILNQIDNIENQLNELNTTTRIIGESEEQTQISAITTTLNCSNSVTALENFKLSFCLQTYNSTANTLTNVYQEQILNIGTNNLFNYLSSSANTGLLICGDSGCTSSFILNDNNLTGYCKILSTQIFNSLIAQAANSGVTLNTNNITNFIPINSFNSDWIRYNTTITDESIISKIANEKLKISLLIEDSCVNFCLLLDNIELNRKCQNIDNTSIIINKSPSFDLIRTVDNKKSWVSYDYNHNREFDLTLRDTNYDLNDYRLVINSKEIDLNIDIASAIETDVWCYINNNPCILTGSCEYCFSCQIGYELGLDANDNVICYNSIDPSELVSAITGTCQTTCGDGCININNLISTQISSTTTINQFKNILLTELIDVKSRKTLSAYPTLRLLYDRYLNSSLYCDTNSFGFNYLSMNQFSNLINTYWVDLIEQVVPSTTIWGASHVYKNTIFDTQKFKYKTHNTFLCDENRNFPFSGIGSATTVEVLYTTLSFDNSGNTITSETQICNGAYIMKRDCGSEFLGTVTTIQREIGNNIFNESGSEIVIF